MKRRLSRRLTKSNKRLMRKRKRMMRKRKSRYNSSRERGKRLRNKSLKISPQSSSSETFLSLSINKLYISSSGDMENLNSLKLSSTRKPVYQRVVLSSNLKTLLKPNNL
jgi:hypothetical protein